MKKIVFIILLLIPFLFDSCSKQIKDDLGLANILLSSVKDPYSNRITLHDIDLYLQAYKNIPKTKSDEIDVTPVVLDQDTLFYLINYNKGWELLSADRRAPRRLVWAEDGNTSIEELYNNPASEAVFQTFVEGMRALLANQEWEPSSSFSESWDDLYLRDGCGPWELVSTTVEVKDTIQDHLTTTRWGQGSPWNDCAPYTNSSLQYHCLTGCVPVAAAQTLYYLRNKFGVSIDTYENCYTNRYIVNPNGHLILDESDVDFASYNHSDSLWAYMPMTESDNSQYFSAVSALMIRMGIYLGVEYQVDGTFGDTRYIQWMFDTFYNIRSRLTTNVNFNTIVEEIIDERCPVILTIGQVNNQGQVHGRHAVVVDAALKISEVTTRVYRKWIPSLDPEPSGAKGPGHDNGSYVYRTEVTEDLLAQYVGINWGFNGYGMYSGSSPIWYNTDAMSWTIVGYTFAVAEDMTYGFYAVE